MKLPRQNSCSRPVTAWWRQCGSGGRCRGCAAGRGLWPQGQHSAWQPGNRASIATAGATQPWASFQGLQLSSLTANCRTGWVCSTTDFARGLLPSCVALQVCSTTEFVGFSPPALRS
eukprot:3261696-Prymnesium_polylepis.1